MATEIGTVVMPVIASFEGIDGQVNKAFGGFGKKAGKDFSKGIGDGLKAAEADLKKAADAYAKLKDKAADALGKIRVEEERLVKARQGGKSDQIAVAEERLNKARRDSSRASRDAEQGNRVLLDMQKRLGDSSDDTGRRLSSLGSSMRTAGTIAGGAALAGITALAAGVVVAGKQLYDLGAQFDDLADTLQVKTGMSGAALDKLTDSVERLGTTNVPSSFADIGDVAAEVTRNLHLTGPAFDAVTSRLANLSRFGMSADVRSLAKVFHGFKIGAEDQAGVLNNLYEITTKTGLSIDELTGAMANGGAPLRALKLGFSDSVGLMVAFEKAGLNGEKAQTALNKAFAYFSKEGIPAEQGLKDIIARITELGDTPQAGELATKVFGGKGGAQFFEAIQNGDLDLQQLQSSLHLTGLDINQVSDDTADWQEKWQDLKNEIAVALKPVGDSIFEQVNEGLDKLSTWAETHQEQIIDFFVKMGDGAISAAEVTITALSGVVDFLHLFDTMVMKGFSWLPGYDDEAAKEFNDSLGTLSDTLHSVTDGSLFKDLRDGLHDLGEEAKTAASNSNDLDKGLGKLAGRKIDITTTINGQPGNLGDIVPGAGAGGTPGQNPLDALTPGGGGQGALMNLQLAQSGGLGGPNTTPRSVGSIDGLLPQTAAVKDQISSQFAAIQEIGGYRADPGFPNEHPAGKALDVMIPNWNTPEGKAYGDQVAAAALKMPGVEYVLWQQTQWNADGTSEGMSDRGGSTANHMDHVHVHVEPAGSADSSQGTSPMSNATSAPGSSLWDSVAQHEGGTWDNADTGNNGHYGGLQFSPETWKAFGGEEFAPRADQATREEQIEVANRTAFTGYKGTPPQGLGAWEAITNGSVPGVTTSTPSSAFQGGSGGVSPLGFPTGVAPQGSTPGVNEYGEQGFYTPDPSQIRESQQRVQDADERVREADVSVADARAARDELDVDASEREVAAADERVKKAEYDAKVARREAEDAKTEAGEAAKGKFSETRPGSKSGTAKGGLSGSLADMAGQAVTMGINGLFETIGADGSFLPDIQNMGIMKTLSAALGLKVTTPEGSYSVMGFQPNNGQQQAGTSNMPFGLPSPATQMPQLPGAAAAVLGAPSGPVDQSTNININNAQGTAEEAANRVRTVIKNTPRVDTHVPPGF